MEDKYSLLLFEEELSPEQQEALRQQLSEDPELAEGWNRWMRIRSHLHRRLQKHLPDRRLLVLYALEQEGYRDALTPREKGALDASRDDLEQAFEDVPALERVVERIQEERADFEAVWEQHEGTASVELSPSPESAPARRSDRAPRPPGSRDRTTRRWTRRLAVAALLLGIAALALWFGPQEEARTTVEVRAGEQRVVELGEGATVRLAGAASLSFSEASDGEDRRITLEHGRAFFDVPRGAEESSFVVETPTATTTVLGTQFGVTTGEDTTGVVLATGKVRVGSADGTTEDAVVLEPGEQSTVQRGQSPASPTPVDLTGALDWSGLFVFRSTPVESIVQRLSTHYDVPITVAPSLIEERVTGTFERNQPVEQVLEALAATLGGEVQRIDGEGYRLGDRS